MSFLQPILLFGLPLALLPIIIHLINQHRHRTVEWAAMMFLFDAKKLTKGIARLRQLLILAMRVLAVAALVFAAGRPLASGWLALAGGEADTVVLLLDRSASMEQQNLETGESKRSAALAKIGDLLEKTGRTSEVVLIDGATLAPTPVLDVGALGDLPETAATDTAADIPALLQAGADYMATNESGRTDLWLASDLRHGDWNPSSGQWQTIRAELAAKDTVRLFLLAYPQAETNNLSVSVDEVKRRPGPDGLQLLMDLTIERQAPSEAGEQTVPVEFTINGTRTVQEMTVSGTELVRLGHTLPLGTGNKRGWGRIDLPADDNPADNTAFFVFDEAAPRKSVVVSDDSATAEAIATAASAPVDSAVSYEAILLGTREVAQVPWEETAQLFWQAPIPDADSTEATLLRQHVESGRTLVLLPPRDGGDASLFGVGWGEWLGNEGAPLEIGWWRTESGLLANTRSGSPLPIGELGIFKSRAFSGETQPLLRLESGEAVVARVITDLDGADDGAVYVWGTLPRTDHSTLAADGVAFFVMVHRGLEEGANAVSRAQFRDAGPESLSDEGRIEVLASAERGGNLVAPELKAGALEIRNGGEEGRLVALNRPDSEDDLRTLSSEALEPLLEGVDYQRIDDRVGSGTSLASEVWRAFLVAMALALLIEAVLCIPPRPAPRRETEMATP
ncbi:MAG: BatA domain-containing protein [Verrucomicrobiales bacterium]